MSDIEFQEQCLGRYILSLPKGWPGREVEFFVNGLTVSRLPDGRPEDVRRQFEARRDQLASGSVTDGAARVVLRWAEGTASGFVLAHSLEQPPGWPDLPVVVEGWVAVGQAVFFVTGTPDGDGTQAQALSATTDVLNRLRPRGTEPPPEPGSCFEGGYLAGPLQGTERASLESNSDTAVDGHLNLALSLTQHATRAGVFDPERFGDLTREYDIVGVPGGERIAVIESDLARDSGLEFLATAGGTVGDRGVELRAELTKQDSFPDTPPYATEDALAIWHTMLRFIRPLP
ncbi:MAG: hypothetical protein AAFQ51_09885 [Pseudomonadota bacterium]